MADNIAVPYMILSFILEKLVGENDILEEKIKRYDMKIKELKETYKNKIKKNNRYKIEMKKEYLQFKETLLAAMDSVPKIFDTQTVNEDLADDDADHFIKSSELEDAECKTVDNCSSSENSTSGEGLTVIVKVSDSPSQLTSL